MRKPKLGVSGLVLILGLSVAASFAGAAAAAQEQDKDSAGAVISKQATAKDVGLPAYPGAKPHADKDSDSASVKMGLWGTTFGFKLAVVKMETPDSPEKVAEFYKKALAKYGKVLDCSNGGQQENTSAHSNALTCEDDKPDKGGMMFKAGTKEKQHIVGIQPNGQGSVFQLVFIQAHGDEEKKAN